ncbi:MAG: hypothetical protein IKG86_06075 [Paludibacteraceae bacterium]|nr:hypothetical protein [Paludibacteraceae bacterium]
MKRLNLLLILLVAALGLQAQTYKNGVWYALYDDEEHAMETQGDYETSVFAPTAGTLNMQWKYQWYDLLGAFKKIDTDVLESADGGNNTNEVGSLQENTGKNSNTTEQFSISRNINWIKYNRSGLPTHRVLVYHQDIRLAQHILLAQGEYGTTTLTKDYGVVNLVDTAAYKVELRSFLTSGDITITSSEPEIFHLGTADNTAALQYAVGANACASKNGTAAQASGATLGKIGNYAFTVYFTPKEVRTYAAVITITDGTSTAKLTVTGEGYKAPTTEYAYEAEVCAGNSYADERFGELTEAGTYVDTLVNVAGGDSIVTLTLQVHPVYAQEDSLVIRVGAEESWQGQDLSLLPEGDTTLVAAYQTIHGCDSTYTLRLTVLPRPTTYGTDTLYTCSGESVTYEGKNYRRPTQEDVLLSVKNQFGGDSIVSLTVLVYPKMKLQTEKTIYVGAEENWQGYDLSQMAIGDTTLTAQYQTIHGCDSIYILQLHVQARPTTYGQDTLHLCQGDEAEYAGRVYTESMTDSILLEEKNQLGGDSILVLEVIAHEVILTTDELTIEEGDSIVWQGQDLSLLPVGDTTLVAQYATMYGCDSTYVLYVSVTEKPVIVDPHEGVDDVRSEELPCRKVLRDGQMYIRRQDGELFDVTGRKVSL